MKVKINNLSVRELLDYEQSCNVICKYYENAIKNYDGSVNTNSLEYKKFQQYNNIRIEIINCLATKVQELE
jgi:hypothetical protein